MGFFDAMKSAASSMAGGAAADLWSKHGDKVVSAITSCANRAAGLGAAYISHDDKYKAAVIDPAWDLLPLPVKLIGRQRLKWDAMFMAARTQLFVVEGNEVKVQPDAQARIEQFITAKLSSSSDTVDTPSKES